MALTSRLRSLTLTVHVTVSVGWLGAVLCSLAIGLTALVSDDIDVVRSCYVVLEQIGWLVLAMSLASLLTGLVQSLGTAWGLFRHYWVIAKLTLNVFATTVLVLYMGTLGALAERADAGRSSGQGIGDLRSGSPVLHAGGALLLLITATALSVYKPRGLTPYGWRRQQR